jgi:hypothetical protein
LLRGVRASERRNIVHRLLFGQPDRTRAFRKEEIAVLALLLSMALSLAEPTERVYFNLSHVTDQGDQETITGWISIRGPVLHMTNQRFAQPARPWARYQQVRPTTAEHSRSFGIV